MSDSPFRDTAGAAEFFGHHADGTPIITVKTMEAWRYKGKGPVYRKLGRRVVYHIADLAAFAEKQRLQSTTEWRQRREVAA
jgi:hypothetical protein